MIKKILGWGFIGLAAISLISFLILTSPKIKEKLGFKSGTNPLETLKDSNKSRWTEIRLRLKWIHQAQFAGFYCADALGFYADEKLKVTIQPGGQDLNAIKLVASGTDHIGIWGAEQIMIACSKGIKIKAIGTVYKDTAAAFVVRKDANIKSFKDIEGKRVGTQIGTDLETIYKALLSVNDVDRSKVNEQNVSYNFGLFLAGRFDVWPGYVVNEPYLAEQQGLPIEIIYPRDNGLHFYGDTIFAKETFLEEHEEEVKLFLKATAKGWNYAIKNPEEAAKITLKYGKTLDVRHQVNMINLSTPLIAPLGSQLLVMEDDGWLEIKKVLRKQNLLQNDVSISDVYTNSYLKKVQK